MDSESYGGILASVVLHKLPSELQLLVSREMGGDELKLDEIMKVVVREIRSRERAVSTPVKKSPKEPSLVAASLTSQGNSKTCTQAHTSISCRVIVRLKKVENRTLLHMFAAK